MSAATHQETSTRMTSRNTPRRRIAKACDTCRRRKEKCNGVRPVCSTCSAANRQCLYVSKAKRRGLPEGWVRTLEKVVALALTTVPELEKMLLSVLQEGITDGGQSDFARLWTDGGSEGLGSKWKRSDLADELQRLLSELDALAAPRGGAVEVGPLSRRVYGLVPLETETETERERVRPEVRTEDSRSLTPSHSLGLQPCEQHDDLPADATRLVEKYLGSVNVWLPMMDKVHLRRAVYRWSHGHQTPDTGDRACLYAIFAVALCQSGEAGGGSDRLPEAFRMADMAAKNFSNPVDFPDTTCVQMQVLLALYQMYLGQLKKAWLMLGRACRTALLLQSRNGEQGHSELEGSSGSSSWWQHSVLACFVLDTILSAELRLPQTIRKVYIDGLVALSEHEPEEWEPGNPALATETGESIFPPLPGSCISTFNRLVEICMVLSVIMESIQSGEKESFMAIQRQLIVASDAQQPDHLRFNTFGQRSSQQALLPQQLTVQLAQLVVLLKTFDTQSCDWFAVRNVQQMGDLAAHYMATFHMSSIPALWRLLLGIAGTHIGKMPRCSNVQLAVVKIHALLSEASAVSPAFTDLEARYSILRVTAGPLSPSTLGEIMSA